MPMRTRLVAAAHADAAGSTPRLNGFSANQTESNPFASAPLARSRARRGSMPPCRRTLSFGSSLITNLRCLSSPRKRGPITTVSGIWVPAFAGTTAGQICRAQDSTSHATGSRTRTGFGEMCVHHPPIAILLAEHHGRAGDELIARVVDVLRRRLLADPVAAGTAVAPDHGHVVGHHTADVERGPVARLHVLPIELPESEPVVASLVGVAVEVEEPRLRRLAPDRIEHLPIEAGIGVDVIGMQLENLLAVLFRAADEISFRHLLPAPFTDDDDLPWQPADVPATR